MILNVIAFRNMRADCFTTPQFVDLDPEKAATQLVRSIKLSKEVAKINLYGDLVLYQLGTFDDDIGKFNLLQEPLLIVDLRPIVDSALNELVVSATIQEQEGEKEDA